VVSGDASEGAVRAHLARLYDVDTARLAARRRYDVQAPCRRRRRHGQVPQDVRLEPGLYVCGDHRDSASIQGALVSGRRAADAVLADLRGVRSTV
jgi:predicted NAD/FAD-dependent oxidoreductase